MKELLCLALLALAVPAAARPSDARLSPLIKADFETAISSYPLGRAFIEGIRALDTDYSWLPVVFAPGEDDEQAWYDPEHNAIFFNSKVALKFLRARGFRGRDATAILLRSRAARAALAASAGPVYMHEFIHAVQSYTYPDYYRDALGTPLEFEYQAFLIGDICLHERLRAEPGLLRALMKGAASDVYVESIFPSYLNFSLDPDVYRERIKKLYEARGGYLSMEKAVEQRRRGLDEAGLKAGTTAYAEGEEAIKRLEAQKAAFAAFLKTFYDKYWPVYSADVLAFVGGMALEEKNYTLALSCLAGADINSGKYHLTPEEFKELKTQGALAVLETASYIRDNAGKGYTLTMSDHIKALEKACEATGRPFPEDLGGIRASVYREAAALYTGMAGREERRDVRDSYLEQAAYFAARSGVADAP